MATKKTKRTRKSPKNPPAPEVFVFSIDALLPSFPMYCGEDEDAFLAFRSKCLSAMKPTDVAEEIWLDDYVVNAWEVKRLQRWENKLLFASRKQAVEKLLSELEDGSPYASAEAKEAARKWSRSRECPGELAFEVLRLHNIDYETILAKALSLKLDDVVRIRKLITNHENRRDAAVSKMEKRRDDITKRLQYAIATDLEFEELQAAV
jgi:hypothetical protein